MAVNSISKSTSLTVNGQSVFNIPWLVAIYPVYRVLQGYSEIAGIITVTAVHPFGNVAFAFEQSVDGVNWDHSDNPGALALNVPVPFAFKVIARWGRVRLFAASPDPAPATVRLGGLLKVASDP